MDRHAFKPAVRPERSKRAAAFDQLTDRIFQAVIVLAAAAATSWIIQDLFLQG